VRKADHADDSPGLSDAIGWAMVLGMLILGQKPKAKAH
jgi:hypothetical protein